MTTDTDDPRFAAALATVEGLLAEVIGQDYYEELEVGPESSFSADLELESVEILQLAEGLINAYGGQIDFIGWFAGMEFEQLVELTVGTLVSFIVSAQAQATAAG
jgi:acyl carrier protein